MAKVDRSMIPPLRSLNFSSNHVVFELFLSCYFRLIQFIQNYLQNDYCYNVYNDMIFIVQLFMTLSERISSAHAQKS